MVLFIILGVIVLVTIGVLSALFLMLNKEQKKEDASAVPVTDIKQLKKEMSMEFLEPQKPKSFKVESDIVPPFEEPKVSLPTQSVKSILEDNEYKKKAKELEDELQLISKKAESQSQEAQQMIETLTKENEMLKSQQGLERAQQNIMDLERQTAELSTENTNLQSQLETSSAKARLLEEQMAAFKIQMGEEISRANATVEELNKEKEILLSTSRPDPDKALREELESLKSEYGQLKQKHENLESSYQNLQYELIKARAQSSGLERVSFNYKNQLEDFFKKINAFQASHDNLSLTKNRLEEAVQEVQLQNEELLKKDQLSQFELEKNRSRLTNLEREYEEFKARVQQQSQ